MELPDCPKCHSNKNIVVLGLGFRCAYCGHRFFVGDVVKGDHEVQTKLVNK